MRRHLVHRRDQDRDGRLPHVERETVQRHRHPVLERQRGDHVPIGADGMVGDDRGSEPHCRVRNLLRPHRPGRPGRQLAPPGREPPERVDVQDDQHHRQGHHDGLGHRGESVAHQRAGEPPSSGRAVRAGRLEIEKDCQEEPQPGQDVAPLGGPRNGFHPQRVDREDEGGGKRPEPEGTLSRARRGAQQAQPHEVEDHRGGGVEQDVRQVIAEGVHPPESMVEAEGEPGDRDPVARERRREHPAQVAPPEPPELGIVDEVQGVVPVQELMPEDGPEHRNGDQDADEGSEPAPLRQRFRGGGPGRVGTRGNGFGLDAGTGAPRRPAPGGHRAISGSVASIRARLTGREATPPSGSVESG